MESKQLELIVMILIVLGVMAIVATILFLGMYVYYAKREKELAKRNRPLLVPAGSIRTKVQIA